VQNQRSHHSLRATVCTLSLPFESPSPRLFRAASRVINMPSRKKAEKPNRRGTEWKVNETKPNPVGGKWGGKVGVGAAEENATRVKKATRPWSNKARLHLWVVPLVSVVRGGAVFQWCWWWFWGPFGGPRCREFAYAYFPTVCCTCRVCYCQLVVKKGTKG